MKHETRSRETHAKTGQTRTYEGHSINKLQNSVILLVF